MHGNYSTIKYCLNLRAVFLMINLRVFLLSRWTHCHREPEVAPCLFPSCRRRWKSSISTKTRAESQTEHSLFQHFPAWTKYPDATMFLTELCLTGVELLLLAIHIRMPSIIHGLTHASSMVVTFLLFYFYLSY